MSDASPHQPRRNQTLLWIAFVVMGMIHIIDFAFYGRAMHNLLSGAGFSLMAYGMYKNGFASEERNAIGRYSALLGAGIAIAAILLGRAG